jgi:apoptosis-inducing factor 3
MFSPNLIYSLSRFFSRKKLSKLVFLASGAIFLSFSHLICNEEDLKELNAGQAKDIKEGAMKKVQVGEDPENYIIISRVGGKLYATGGKCSHYGAPLHAGFLDGYMINCPWHCAAFDVRSGEILHAPGLNSIPTYDVTEKEDQVLVHIPEHKWNAVSNPLISKQIVRRDLNNPTTFVVIGGGAAGEVASETLRREGFTGRIIMLTAEPIAPYDRVPLSKDFKTPSQSLIFRKQSFYDLNSIELVPNASVISIDQQRKSVLLQTGAEVSYDKLLLASGCQASVPAEMLDICARYTNVFTLRSAADHDRLSSAAANANNIVIVGAGFIGLEVAKTIKSTWHDKTVTVVDRSAQPMSSVFGLPISQQMLALQRKNGIKIISDQQILKFEGENNSINKVLIEETVPFSGSKKITEITADLVLLTTGSKVCTSFVPSELLTVDGAVKVNSHLQTANTDIYAAGDIAEFPSLLTEQRERVEAWGVAQQQGRVAALNMLGRGQNYLDVPFFWSSQFANATFAGFNRAHDWTYTESSGEEMPEKTRRITYFFRGERCVGVAAINSPGAAQRMKIALQRGLMPTRKELASGKAGFESILEKVKNSSPCLGNCCRGKREG